MYVCAIADGGSGCGEQALLALFRQWDRHRQDGANPLPAMARQAAEHGRQAGLAADASAQLAVACDSFFALTEASLARALQAGSDDGPPSADECALLATLRQVPVLQAVGPNPVLPHGLPGALQWAGFAVLRWLDLGEEDQVEISPADGCPYSAGSAGHPAGG
ncbi:hypothetical protein [Croceibacterium ferulae]|uniref:hypothetical protein n=1 Tax=Croceibacterium ferulae TaxID=1854641 RepID=UPI000F86938C|nr:hypothetical protein [Croceibacterium ferulae]